MRPGYVYLIAFDEGEDGFSSPVKVGIAHDPISRLYDLQVACPFVLGLVDKWEFPSIHVARRREQLFHEYHDDFRLQGEWFDVTPEAAAEKLNEWDKKALLRDSEPSGLACEILGYRTFVKVNQAVSVAGKLSRVSRAQKSYRVRRAQTR